MNTLTDLDLVLVNAAREVLVWDPQGKRFSAKPNQDVRATDLAVSSLSFDNSYEVLELDDEQTAAILAAKPGDAAFGASVELRRFGAPPLPISAPERVGYSSFITY